MTIRKSVVYSYEVRRTLHLLAMLQIRPSEAQTVQDARDETLADEPFASGLQRLENIYVDIYVDDHWSQQSRIAGRRRCFAPHSRLQVVSKTIIDRAVRVLFADPARPNRIIFDRYPRQPDALEQFVQLNRALRFAKSVDDLERLRESETWPIVAAAL